MTATSIEKERESESEGEGERLPSVGMHSLGSTLALYCVKVPPRTCLHASRDTPAKFTSSSRF